MDKIKSEYHCAYCNYHWQEEREQAYINAPCVLPCPKCREYEVNRGRVLYKTYNGKVIGE